MILNSAIFYINLRISKLQFMIRYCLVLFTLICLFQSKAQDSLNLKQLGRLPYSDLTSSQKLNDIWGYVDEFGTEYALVGLKNGVSVASISPEGVPKEIGRIPGPTSTWRDLKTFNDFAFVVHDTKVDTVDNQGLLVIDLREVENDSISFKVFDFGGLLQRSHNIYIDENGIAYLTGSNVHDGGVGGALMIDVNDPNNPLMVGLFNEYYLHDCVTRNDTMWGGAIYQGVLIAVDVKDKTDPKVIGIQETPNLFTHNCWFSDDGKYIFTTDERSDASVASYDISDVENIKYLDRIQSFYSDKTIPHNTHFINNYLVTSYYRDGLQIVDAQYPDNLIDVGHYDTAPNLGGNGFNGAWGAYPYLPSGRILVSDMERGLFVFEPTYKRGSYLEVSVVDSNTRNSLPGAEIELLNNIEILGVTGVLKTGTGKPGVYKVKVSLKDYETRTVEVNLKENIITKIEIALPEYIPTLEETDLDDLHIVFPSGTNTVVIKSLTSIKGGFYLNISNILGQIVAENEMELIYPENEFELPNEKGICVISLTDKNGNRIKQVKYSQY